VGVGNRSSLGWCSCARSPSRRTVAELLDEEEVKLLVGEAIGHVVSEVERIGGYVKDLAGTESWPSSGPPFRTKTTLSVPPARP